MTEPKRVISGAKTKAEMICGVYIDPKTLDTYVVNNDTQNWLAVFSKSAKGNVAPDRFLARNDSYAFFAALGDLIHTGPTGTNVGDLQIVLIG